MKIGRFILYISLVIIIGGLGCLIALGQYFYDSNTYGYHNFVLSLGTFSISLASLSLVDFMIGEKRTNKTLSLALYLLKIISVIASVTCILLHFKISAFASSIIATIGFFIALICRILVDWRSPKFTDEDPFAAIGGKYPTKTSA